MGRIEDTGMGEIVKMLRQEGHSLKQISNILLKKYNVSVTPMTISNYCNSDAYKEVIPYETPEEKMKEFAFEFARNYQKYKSEMTPEDKEYCKRIVDDTIKAMKGE